MNWQISRFRLGDNTGANINIEYGILNAKDDMKYAFYERQQPYEVPLKAAFLSFKRSCSIQHE